MRFVMHKNSDITFNIWVGLGGFIILPRQIVLFVQCVPAVAHRAVVVLNYDGTIC